MSCARRWRRAPAVAVALLTVACSRLDYAGPSAYEPKSLPPTEQAIERGARDILQRVKLVGTPEVSELRKALPSAPADWLVCVRSSAPPFRPYAAFFKGDELVDYRLAVLYDDCAREMYVPLIAEGQ